MSGRVGRNVLERIFIEGVLTLVTPAHFGSGDQAGLADMTLIRDACDPNLALLTGASIAGALRAYLREVAGGYGARHEALSEALFGKIDDQYSIQSWLMVDDALGKPAGVELRDGVAIDPATRTAEDGKKYDVELLAAGTSFALHFEFLLTQENRHLLPVLAVALRGLKRGDIYLGQRKRRGFGQCVVDQWQVRRFDVADPAGLIGWLEDDRSRLIVNEDICAALGVTGEPVADKRTSWMVDAVFDLPGSLLIRSGGRDTGEPDMVHLTSKRAGEDAAPVLSGTSLAGALRARALRIANTVCGDASLARHLVDEMFGRRIKGSQDEPSGSRFTVQEALIEGSRRLVQSRVKLDRFTGGSFPQALFSQEPAIGGVGAGLKLHLELRQRVDDPLELRKAHIGLLLLVLKDLWTGDLPLGGESSVGRGRLRGRCATLTMKDAGMERKWELVQTDGGLNQTPLELEAFVQALWDYRLAVEARRGAK